MKKRKENINSNYDIINYEINTMRLQVKRLSVTKILTQYMFINERVYVSKKLVMSFCF
jgi:hypothetical protein